MQSLMPVGYASRRRPALIAASIYGLVDEVGTQIGTEGVGSPECGASCRSARAASVSSFGVSVSSGERRRNTVSASAAVPCFL